MTDAGRIGGVDRLLDREGRLDLPLKGELRSSGGKAGRPLARNEVSGLSSCMLFELLLLRRGGAPDGAEEDREDELESNCEG